MKLSEERDLGVNSEDENEPIVIVEIAPIDEGYAWVICGCCFILNACTWGMNSGFSIYLAHYINYGTFPGMTKMDYAYIGGLAFGGGLFFAPVLILLYDFLGIHAMVTLGNSLQFTALMLASFAKNKWQIYCSQGLLQGFGLAVLSLPTLTLLPQYFVKYRVLASSIATAGAGLGGVIFNLAMQKIVDNRSVFWAIRAQAIMAFGLIGIATVFIRSKTPRKSLNNKLFDNLIVYIQLDFIIFGLFAITAIFAYVILLYTLTKFTTSLGYTNFEGSITSAMVQVGSFFGRPIVGQLSDRFGAISVTSSCYLICGIFSLAMWIPARNLATVIIFALIEGGLMGSIYGMLSPVLQRMYGPKRMLSIFAKLWMIVGIAGLFSPVIGIKLTKSDGAEVDPTSFVHCSIFTGVCFIAASGFLVLLRGHINAREHILQREGTETYQKYVPVPILKILSYSVKPPIKIGIEKIILNEKDDNEETIIETKSQWL